MSLEAYNGNLSDLVITNPTPTDPKSQGDDHLRGIKKTLVDTFGATTGPIYGPSGVTFPDGSVQGSAAYSKAESDGPAFRAYKSGVAQGISGGAVTPVALQSEEFDTADAFGDNAFIAPIAGFYQVSGSVAFAAGTGVGHAALLVDDLLNLVGGDVQVGSVSNISVVSGLVFLGVGSILKLGAYCSTSVNINPNQSETQLSGFLARRA